MTLEIAPRRGGRVIHKRPSLSIALEPGCAGIAAAAVRPRGRKKEGRDSFVESRPSVSMRQSGYPGRRLDPAQIALDEIEADFPGRPLDFHVNLHSAQRCFAQFPEGVGKSRPPVGAPIADVSLTSGAGGASSPPRTAGSSR